MKGNSLYLLSACAFSNGMIGIITSMNRLQAHAPWRVRIWLVAGLIATGCGGCGLLKEWRKPGSRNAEASLLNESRQLTILGIFMIIYGLMTFYASFDLITMNNTALRWLEISCGLLLLTSGLTITTRERHKQKTGA